MKLKNLTFHATGCFELHDKTRYQVFDLIKKNGGKIELIIGDCDYLVVGKHPVKSKTDRARKHNVTIISYSQLTMMLEIKPKPQSIFPEMQRLLNAH